MEDMWHLLMNDPNTGVIAGIYYMTNQIQKISPAVFLQPIRLKIRRKKFRCQTRHRRTVK